MLARRERHHDFDTAFGSEQRHALVACKLQGAAKHELPTQWKGEDSARQTVYLERRIPVDQRNHALGFRLVRIAGSDDGVAADVIERTAANRELIAHVIRVEHAEQKRGLDEPELADSAGLQE